jgi:methylphosphotriester-DNA--protein-cysteine methyltransferase
LVHYSPAHFARAFKVATGEPPHRYVLQRRLQRAKAAIVAGLRGRGSVEQAFEAEQPLRGTPATFASSAH